jgi:sulfite exporter TauE/SafE
MTNDLGTLGAAAVSLGFFHCLLGPDHYVPFVAMSRVGLWSLRKTLLVTVLCGVGHVASSVALGFVGVALGIIVLQLQEVESARGSVAGWLLVAFGSVYLLWGTFHAVRRLRRSSAATDQNVEDAAEAEANQISSRSGGYTPWILFLVFVFGPCEPLIPLLIYPAAKASVWSVIWVTALFGITTLVTMTTLVAMIYLGVQTVRFPRAEPFGHAIAGAVVLACGLAITVFGL